MPDLYATICEVDPSVQERLADILEMRAVDPRQREMLASYLSEIDFRTDARVLEIGCGTGGVTRTLAQWPGISEAVGVDPSPWFAPFQGANQRQILWAWILYSTSYRFTGEGPKDNQVPIRFRCSTPGMDQSHTPAGKIESRRAFSSSVNSIS